MSRYRSVDPHNVEPLHGIRESRVHHLRELIERMRRGGWQGRPIVVEETAPNRYQAWTGTHRLAAARRLGLRVPVLLIDKTRWIRRWGEPAGLVVDEVDDDMDKYVKLLAAGDTLAARILHQEIELNLGGDSQNCGIGPAAHPCL